MTAGSPPHTGQHHHVDYDPLTHARERARRAELRADGLERLLTERQEFLNVTIWFTAGLLDISHGALLDAVQTLIDRARAEHDRQAERERWLAA